MNPSQINKKVNLFNIGLYTNKEGSYTFILMPIRLRYNMFDNEIYMIKDFNCTTPRPFIYTLVVIDNVNNFYLVCN
jgi:hypothetical protein